ncbi:ABC transporter substrate-binding protein [Actinokineospora iranica]|uniref:ABC-type branched-chain amino acid transport system, substrate-binding protein n=1 Tax=Actinokineospora iranica TaxID=1271860 RepID=A0A1G6QHN4_9PSEU|nr:ABC transporter substrate-binding protein [Actinokineospora iranica]SDC91226.1 ABC-type branched-chain amino acid transport system, substrate-binding protein [Actinokineospora iranica]
MRSRSAAALTAAAVFAASAACGAQSGANDGDTVKVGAILSLSGIYSTLGPAQKNALTMGVEALNKTGFTVGGRKRTLEISYADDRSDAATTGVTALREMVQAQKIPVIAYGLGSDTYVPQLKRQPIPMVNILDSSYPGILDLSQNLFLTRGASPTYVPGCLHYAKRNLGTKSISVITAKGEPYAEGLTQLVAKSAQTEGVAIAATAEFPLSSTDYSNAIGAALAAKPDAVYLSSVTAVILPVLKQLRQSGYTGPVIHSSGVNPDQAEAILGAQFDSIMKDNYDCAGTLPTTSANPAAKSFAEAYQARFNEYPQDLTMWAHDFPFIVAAAMTKADSVTDPEKIQKALSEITVPEGTVSGWLPGDGGLLFTGRNARTASEVTAWCAGKRTLRSAMVFDTRDGAVVDPVFPEDTCA